MRLDNDATHLADAQSRRKETAKKEKGVFRGHPEHRQRALPSALPKTVGERVGSGRLGTALQGDASVPTPLPPLRGGRMTFCSRFAEKEEQEAGTE